MRFARTKLIGRLTKPRLTWQQSPVISQSREFFVNQDLDAAIVLILAKIKTMQAFISNFLYLSTVLCNGERDVHTSLSFRVQLNNSLLVIL